MKKFILSSFILFLSFFGIKNVNAAPNLSTMPLNLTGLEVTTEIVTRSFTTHYFADLGKGHLIFSFVTYGTPSLAIQGVYVDSYPSAFTCSFTTLPYYDNGYNDYASYSVDCPVQMGNQGLTAIYFHFPGVAQNQKIQTSYNMTFVPDTAENFSQLLNVTQQLYTDIGFGFARQYDQLNVIKDTLTSSKELNQKILDKLEESNEQIDKVKESIDKVDDTINSTDTTGSQSQANSFFEGFESDDYGLSDIITMPLELIRGLTSNSCVALNLTIPFVNKSFDLPCMSSIYQEYFGNFFALYQTITFGFVAYWVVVKIFALVKGFKDPDDDKVEVMDL